MFTKVHTIHDEVDSSASVEINVKIVDGKKHYSWSLLRSYPFEGAVKATHWAKPFQIPAARRLIDRVERWFQENT